MSVPSETSGLASMVALIVVVVVMVEDDESESPASKDVVASFVVEWVASGWAASVDKEDGMEVLMRLLVASMLSLAMLVEFVELF